jgi:hypothetical protein
MRENYSKEGDNPSSNPEGGISGVSPVLSDHPPYSTVADPESDTGGLFMSDTATGFSVLALTQADRSN